MKSVRILNKALICGLSHCKHLTGFPILHIEDDFQFGVDVRPIALHSLALFIAFVRTQTNHLAPCCAPFAFRIELNQSDVRFLIVLIAVIWIIFFF